VASGGSGAGEGYDRCRSEKDAFHGFFPRVCIPENASWTSIEHVFAT
jgi:hypothetical protein